MCRKCVKRARQLWDAAKSLDDAADAISDRARAANVPLSPSQDWLQRRYRTQAELVRDIADLITPDGGVAISSLLKKEVS